MKTAIIGAGAMGSLFGSWLAQAEHDVTLIDVWQENVDAINADGLRVTTAAGEARVAIRATTSPADLGVADLVIVFVKCYHTEEAVRSAAPIIGPETAVLTLQNGWGNAARVASVVGEERVLAGLTYNSATVLGPGHIQEAGRGRTVIGELDGRATVRLAQIAGLFASTGIEVATSPSIVREIWAKLAHNVCALPPSALLHVYAGQLTEHDGTLRLMRAMLEEVVAVAAAQGIALDVEERWAGITGLLRRSSGAKASMLQDVERRRRTEIDVINGAIVAAGQQHGIPTPYNQAMVWLIKALEETF